MKRGIRWNSHLVHGDADLVVIGCPNRQGRPLTLAALNAADTVVYAATASGEGLTRNNDAGAGCRSVRERHGPAEPILLPYAAAIASPSCCDIRDEDDDSH